MQSPEDVIIESIAAASIYGDSPGLRERQCRKLVEILKLHGIAYLEDDGDKGPKDK